MDLDAVLVLATGAKERASLAEPGPWVAKEMDVPPDDPFADYLRTRCDGIDSQSHNVVSTDCGVYDPDIDTARFIAAARDDVPALADAVMALVARVRELEGRR